MKQVAISVKQPFAFLLCSGIKDIENRSWRLPRRYIGKRVFIHASAKPVMDGSCISHYLTDEQYYYIAFNTPALKMLDTCFLEHHNSAIIGSVEFVDCTINHPSIWAEKSEVGQLDEPTNEYGKPIYNWAVANPILFDKPIPCKGKLSFWDCTELVKRIRHGYSKITI